MLKTTKMATLTLLSSMLIAFLVVCDSCCFGFAYAAIICVVCMYVCGVNTA